MLLALVLSAAPDAALLQKLGERALALEAFAKQSTVTVDVSGEEYDGEGKVKASSRAVVKVERKGEAAKRTLISFEENGKEITEKKRKEVEAQETKATRGPFHPEEQSKYVFTQLEPAKTHPTWVRIGFGPAKEKGEQIMVGEALVDPEGPTLRRLSMRPSKFPAFVDSVAIEAELDAPTSAGMAMSSLEVRGVAGALFFKKRFRTVTRFRDYVGGDAP